MYKKINLDKLVIYDIETFKNCLVFNFKDFKSKSKKQFIIYDDKKYKGDQEKLILFLKQCIKNTYTFTGFNVLGFDAQVIQYILDDEVYLNEPKKMISLCYQRAQDLISSSLEEKWQLTKSENKLFAPHIDVFKQLHYDRPQKATSLKWLEFTMRYHTVEDMPFEHTHFVELEEIDDIVSYCWNDVDATERFFELVKFETEVRLNLSKEYDLNLINAPEPKMVREIFGKFLSEEMKITYSDLRNLKTPRSNINFKDIIFPYVKFYTPEFQKILDDFKNVVINIIPGEKANFSYSFNFQNMKVDLGLGGIHACVSAGVYNTHPPSPLGENNINNEEWVIRDIDATSYYPFLAIKNNLKPEHLGDAFSKVYPIMYEERKKYDKKDPRNYIFKIILNSAYGLSNEPNTYLYDPLYTYSVSNVAELKGG